jgi:serine protease AprX
MKNIFWPVAALLTCLLGMAPAAHAQTGAMRRYFVYFKDKAGTPYTVGQPQAFLSARAVARRTRQGIVVRPRDLPVSPTYLAQVRAVSGSPQVVFTSRWLNGAVLTCDSATLRRVQQLPAVGSAQLLSRVLPAAPAPARRVVPTPTPPAPTTPRATYGKAYAQNQLIGAVAMHNAGFRGEGMQLAIFDAGFPGADSITALQRVQQGRVASTRNFVDGGRRVYLRNGHGTACLSLIGGELPGFYVGTAPRATFHLVVTEDVASESPMEEANWLAAAEYADSAGVDIISSSLGYTGFDDATLSHTYADLTGRTAIGSRAALGAARAGMVVVNAAGNDGDNNWHYVGVPADADSIISVGAVDSLRNHAGFSSYGPTADGRLAPTLSAMGVASAVLAPNGAAVRGNGTSYACPEVAGLVAGFWQANPTLTAQQVVRALKNGASQAQSPDNTLGWGIVNFVTSYNLLHPNTPLAATEAFATAEDPLAIFPNPSHLDELTLALPSSLRGQVLRVRLLDVKGALLSEQLLPGSPATTRVLRQPARRLAPGAYLCTVQPIAGGVMQTLRFTRQ